MSSALEEKKGLLPFLFRKPIEKRILPVRDARGAGAPRSRKPKELVTGGREGEDWLH
jgi:hypothetical protein